MTKYLFIDRDGTLVSEPEDQQVDALNKIQFEPQVIPVLLRFIQAGYKLIMVSNQDGRGTDSFPEQDFQLAQNAIIEIFASQGVQFEQVLICPHFPEDNCDCRKPKVSLVLPFLQRTDWDREKSYVIGDRQTDCDLANNMGINGILYNQQTNWPKIAEIILDADRTATITRQTKETQIEVTVNLDTQAPISIQTGIGFFDHMLEQIAKHGGFAMEVKVQGDLHIDEHHTVEDTALAIGQALKKALDDKRGINRYGFYLPMDEALCQLALDLSGRPYFVFEGKLPREQVGELPTELVPHFFESLAQSLQANLHISVTGDNAHHMIEAMFKALGRSLRQAITQQNDYDLPSTKGVL